MPATFTDPVCGMKVDAKEAEKVEYKGKPEYFCSEECKTAFEKDPARYEKAEATARKR